MTRIRRPAPIDTVTAAVFIGVLVLYMVTTARSLPWGDGPEFVSVAATLGVAHPPGYPLYTMLSALAVRVPLGSPVARLSFLSAITGAMAAALLVRVTWRVADLARGRAGSTGHEWLTLAGATLAGLLAAVVPEMHAQSTVPEVYAPAAAVFAAVLLLLLPAPSGARTPDGRSSGARRFVAAGLVFGVGLAHHLTILLALPGFLVLAALKPRRRPVAWLGATAAALAALTSYAYLPIRSALDPPVLWAPIDSLDALIRHVTGAQYASRLGATSPLVAVHGLRELLSTVVDGAGLPLLIAALCGLVVLWKLSRRHAVALLLVLVLTLTHAALYSIPDIEAYLIPFYLVCGVLAGLAVALIPVAFSSRSARSVVVAVVLLCALVGWGVATMPQRLAVARTRGVGAADFLEQLISGLEPGALVLARSDETVFPLWYARYVEERRQDIAVLDVRSRAPHLERHFPGVRFPTESELASWFGQEGREDCFPTGRTVLPIQRYAPLLVELNVASRPIYADYELARAQFVDRSRPNGSVARVASASFPPGELSAPEELLLDEPWGRWTAGGGHDLCAQAGRGKVPDEAAEATDARRCVDPRTIETVASRLEAAAKLYLVRGRPEDAAAIIESVVELAPDMARAWNDLGVAYVATGRVDEGIVALDRAAELDPSEASTRANLFDAHRRAGRGEEALRHISAAIRLDPGTTRYRSMLASYLEHRGDPGAAADVLEEARRAAPGDHAAALAQGDLLVRQGRYSEALSVYRQAEALEPGSPAVQSSMGRCYWALRDVKRALDAMGRSVELQPQNPRLRYDLAVMLRAIGEPDEALGHLSEAQRVLPNMWRADILTAAILTELGRHSEAEEAFSNAKKHGADVERLLAARREAAVARGDSAALLELAASLADSAQ